MRPLRRPPRTANGAGRGIGWVFATSVLAASVGAALAWYYAEYTLPKTLLDAGHARLYAVLGAVCAVLGLRLASVIRSVMREWTRPRPPTDPPT
ncbi:MAG: hypothetical protein HY791_04415 [Deltaproteobacteria bacterium]|nr:hypothetical protein [Deltaproteobacteria bacterium]